MWFCFFEVQRSFGRKDNVAYENSFPVLLEVIILTLVLSRKHRKGEDGPGTRESYRERGIRAEEDYLHF